ncbi:hypothetical protein ND856_14040 [Leptospira bandrabouensis]|uniref:hypothetical protein n=1 Tax=Leptospira bandrabouensis TaxID=2484903 RepID=UPI00223DB476|nr:hypothetical protein [Leptospira bandrabouensis]MCW7459571.1 hypothetical protein [Leptospira bandrabouensis]MCW7478411.1 hypothetical protein [Leptospira bandrabouensis]MCW7486306.1 hypothetical protein [Leptospira bandrabouensis]
MIIANGEECKEFIRFNLKKKTLSEFAREEGLNYDYLSKSLNGQHSYRSIRDAFDRLKIPYRLISTAKTPTGKVAA